MWRRALSLHIVHVSLHTVLCEASQAGSWATIAVRSPPSDQLPGVKRKFMQGSASSLPSMCLLPLAQYQVSMARRNCHTAQHTGSAAARSAAVAEGAHGGDMGR